MSGNTLISDTSLVSVERPLIMRALDYPGSIPIVGGIPVGVIRMTCGFAGAIIAGVGALFAYCCSDEWHGRFTFAAKYLLDEFERGIFEVLCLSDYFDSIKTSREESNGTITDAGGASGRYIYESPSGYMAYSNNDYNDQTVEWNARMMGSEVHGVIGRIERPVVV